MNRSRVLSIVDFQPESQRSDVLRLRLKLPSDTDGNARRDTFKKKPVFSTEVNGWSPRNVHLTQEASISQLQAEVANFKQVRNSMEEFRKKMYGQTNGINTDIEQHIPGSKVFTERVITSELSVEIRQGPSASPSSYTSTDTQTDVWGDEPERLREVSRKLYKRLQETERRHESERRALESESSQYRAELWDSQAAQRRAQDEVQSRDQQIQELQRLVTGMEQEHGNLQTKIQTNELLLREMRSQSQIDTTDHHRSAQLEREVEGLQEKVHHLDDMLKSQQRKIRQMIDQLQKSRSQMEEKDLLINQLQDRVSHLESENQEMQDRLEFYSATEVEARGTWEPEIRGPGETPSFHHR
uniref:Tuftelin n=2 Tax=Callorhinchus milii TaxID=7868 RepID=V9L2N0_CALMI